MRYIEAFSTDFESNYTKIPEEISVFLAGGISGCYDWQKDVVNSLSATDLAVINPRRKNYIDDPKEAEKQIVWEHEHLNKADLILFWFPHETLCPITLYEYGKFIVSNKPIFVGCDPNYKRVLDLVVQTRLERPYSKIYSDLNSLVGNFLQAITQFK